MGAIRRPLVEHILNLKNGRVRPPPIFLSFGSLSLGAGRLGPFWDILGQSESRRSWRTSRRKNQTRALGRREAPSAPKGPEGPLGPWGGPMGPPRALGWGVGGGAMRKHVPAERMNELKHVPAKLGESKLGSTATTRRVKQSSLGGSWGRGGAQRLPRRSPGHPRNPK